MDYRLPILLQSSLGLYAFSDADWAVCPITCQSTSKLMFQFLIASINFEVSIICIFILFLLLKHSHLCYFIQNKLIQCFLTVTVRKSLRRSKLPFKDPDSTRKVDFYILTILWNTHGFILAFSIKKANARNKYGKFFLTSFHRHNFLIFRVGLHLSLMS